VDAPTAEHLKKLFGNYKAEWLRGQIFDLFTRPAYFPELETQGPCLLVGGRGTGKTTVLRSLSYEGRFALSNRDVNSIKGWPYYGFYYRVDTNRVTAFRGPELTDDTWTKLFGHYFNILLCGQVLNFLKWYYYYLPTEPSLPPEACRKIAITLHIENATTSSELLTRLNEARLRFEAYLNNLHQDRLPPLSLQSAPIDELISSITDLPQFVDKYFFFLIDEYENLLDNQQIVANTLIKHSGAKYSFKIGVRELGWRKRVTLNANEQLISPADYARVSIAEKLKDQAFDKFALDICNQRLARLPNNGSSKISIEAMFKTLSEETEAELLGVREIVANRLRRFTKPLPLDRNLSPLEMYFALFWADAHELDLSEVLSERAKDPKRWRTRYENYKHAILFTIRRKRSGTRKYYSGWRSFVQLSGANIRYLLDWLTKHFYRTYSEATNLANRSLQTRRVEPLKA
jgi:hypothetical protein